MHGLFLDTLSTSGTPVLRPISRLEYDQGSGITAKCHYSRISRVLLMFHGRYRLILLVRAATPSFLKPGMWILFFYHYQVLNRKSCNITIYCSEFTDSANCLVERPEFNVHLDTKNIIGCQQLEHVWRGMVIFFCTPWNFSVVWDNFTSDLS